MDINDWNFFYNMFEDLYMSDAKFFPYDVSCGSTDIDESGNEIEGTSLFYAYVSDYVFGSSCIKTLNDDYSNNEFKKYKGDVIYHGFTCFDYGARELTSWNHHYGRGIYGSGFYTTTDKADAMRYSSDFRANISSSVDKVLPLKVINERKKSVVYEDIANVAMRVLYEDEFEPINPNLQERFDALLEFLDTIPESDAKKEFIRCLNSNPSIIAIMFGFNYMERRTAQSRNHDIVLDRSLLVAPRSNAQMFLDNSVDFKNGVLDTITLEEIYQDKQIKENAK